MSEIRKFAVIENNKVINVICGVPDEVVLANPGVYIEYTNGWDYDNDIDGAEFFTKSQIVENQLDA